MQKIIVIDYGAGNVRSCAKAIERAAANININASVNISANIDDIASADRLFLPGQGAFKSCMQGLQKIDGLCDILTERILKNAVPFFGICVGMQLLADIGIEHEMTDGLGWIGGKVIPLDNRENRLKIPHMGWNKLTRHTHHPALPDDIDGKFVYFVHSYHMQLNDASCALLSCFYGQKINAMIAKDNIIGTQFHPEKSQDVGLSILQSFLRWRP